MELRTRRCRVCLAAIQYDLFDIQLKYACVRCCATHATSSSNSVLPYLISEALALDNCQVTAEDVAELNYILVANPSEAHVEKYYMRAEVWCVRNLRRRQDLEAEIGLQFKSFSVHIRQSILENYLTQLDTPTIPKERVIARCSVLDRALEVYHSCPRTSLTAALDFCVDHPTGGPTDFIHLRDSMREAFWLEGDRILSCIPTSDRENLHSTPLADVGELFAKRDSDAILKAYLLKWFSTKTVESIMQEDRNWRGRPWANGAEDRVSIKLRDFWKERTRRAEKLEDALAAQRVFSFPSSAFYQDYINGDGDYKLREVVALIHYEDELWDRLGLMFKSSKGEAGVRELLYNMNEARVGHYLSVRRALEAAEDYPITDEETDDDDDDYDEDY